MEKDESRYQLWEGGQDGVEGGLGTGLKGRRTGEEGARIGKFWGWGYIKKKCILLILLNFMYFNAITGYQKYQVAYKK